MLLSYDIAVVGAANVDKALSGIERRFVQHNTRVDRMVGKGGAKSSAPGAGASVVAREGIAAERKILAERERAERYVARLRQRHQLDAQRQEERAAKAAGREHERAVRHVEGIKRRSFAERDRLEAREATRSMRQRQRFAERTTGTIGSSVRSTLGGVGRMAGGALAIGGGFAAADAVNRNLDLGRRFRQLTIQSAAPGQENPISGRQVQSRVESLATERGIDREDLTAGLEVAVAKTGDLAEGMRNLEQFAVLGQAFNATTVDMASAATVLGSKFNLTGEELADTLATLGAQGRKAAFEFKDMSQLVERLATAGQRFDLQGAEGVKTLGGLAQITRTAEGTPESTATAIESAVSMLMTKSADIKSGKVFGGRKGVEVFEGGDSRNNARDLRAVLTDVVVASGGRQEELSALMGNRGISVVTPLATAFKKANLEAGGGKKGEAAGRAAIEAIFKNNIDAAGTYADAQKDAAKLMEDDSVKMKIATEKISIALGQLTPIVVRLAESLAANEKQIGQIARGVAGVASFLISNPFRGIGTIIAAKIIADLAGAAIGAKVGAALQSLLTRAGGPGGAVPGAGVPGVVAGGAPGKGKGAKAGRALGGIAAATIALPLGMELGSGLIDLFEAATGDGSVDNRERSFANAFQDIKDLNAMKPMKQSPGIGKFQRHKLNAEDLTVKDFVETGDKVQFMTAAEGERANEAAKERGDKQRAEKLTLDTSKFDASAALSLEAAKMQVAAAEKNAGAAGPNRSDSPTQPRK